MANYIDSLISFIDRQRTLYTIDTLKTTPVVSKYKYTFEGRGFDHMLDLNALDKDTQVSYCLEDDLQQRDNGGVSVCNYFHFDGTPVVDAEDFDEHISNEGLIRIDKEYGYDEMNSWNTYGAVIVWRNEAGKIIYFYLDLDNDSTEEHNFFYLSHVPSVLFENNCQNDFGLPNIPPSFLNGYIDVDAKLYFNLRSECDLSAIQADGVYDNLVVHDVHGICSSLDKWYKFELKEREEGGETGCPEEWSDEINSSLFIGSGNENGGVDASCGKLSVNCIIEGDEFKGVVCKIELLDDDKNEVIETLYPDNGNGFDIILHDFSGHYLYQKPLLIDAHIKYVDGLLYVFYNYKLIEVEE